MSADAKYAWQTAERSCFDYLLNALGALENVEGYLAEFPLVQPKSSGLNAWCFELNGGGNTIRAQTRTLTSWRMNARILGIFTERTLAQQVSGILRDCLPILPTDNIRGVSELHPVGEPQLTRDTAYVDEDVDSSGGQIRVWKLEYPMECVFYNTDEIT